MPTLKFLYKADALGVITPGSTEHFFDSVVSGTIAVDTTVKLHGYASVKHSLGAGPTATEMRTTSVIADAGWSLTSYFRFSQLPATNTNAKLLSFKNSSGTEGFSIQLRNGVLVLTNSAGTVLGTGPTVLAINTWYCIKVSATITSTTVNRFIVWIASMAAGTGVAPTFTQEINLTNVTISTATLVNVSWGAGSGFGASGNVWWDDLIVDDDASLVLGPHLLVTNKRPVSNGALQQFDTTVSGTNSGYGTGNAIYVNERPMTTTGARSLTPNTGVANFADNYVIEAENVGDEDISGAVLVYRLFWVHGQGAANDTIWVNGVAQSPHNTQLSMSNPGIHWFRATASSHLTNTAAVAPIGLARAANANADLILNEAGVLYGYTPPQTVALSGIANAAVVGSPAVQPGSVTVSPTGVTNTSGLGSPSLALSSPTVLDLAAWEGTGDLSYFIGGTSGAVSLDTVVNHCATRSLKLSTGSPAVNASARPPNALADAGRRVMFYYRFNQLPVASGSIMRFEQVGGVATIFNLDLTTGGLLRTRGGGIGNVSGTTVLVPGQWYRITVTYKITSTTVWEIHVYLDGVLEITNSNNGTFTNTGTLSILPIAPSGNGANFISWFDDIYTDDGWSLGDPGDIRLVNKRPNANGTNTFDTTTATSNSGYGTGNAVYVNQRPISTTGARRYNGAGTAVENYGIEATAVGDVDLSHVTLVAREAWVHGSGVATDTIYDKGVASIPPIAFTSTATFVKSLPQVTSAYVPSGNDVGMGRPVANATNAVLNEAGVIFAFIPASQTVSLTGIAPTGSVGSPAIQATVTVGLVGIASTGSVGSPTVTPGSVTVSLSGIASTSQVGAPSIVPGSVTVSLTGIAGTGSVGSPTITTLTTVVLSGIASTSDVGTPAVEPGSVTVVLVGIDSSGSVGQPIIETDDITIVRFTGIPESSSVGQPTVTPGPVTISITGIDSTAVAGVPTVTSSITVQMLGVDAASTLGIPTVIPGSVVVALSGIASGSTVGLPTLINSLLVRLAGIASITTVGQPSLLPGAVSISVLGIPSTSQVGIPTILIPGLQIIILEGIDATDVVGIIAVYQPTHLEPPTFIVLDGSGETYLILDTDGGKVISLDTTGETLVVEMVSD